jgi:hypothetical protein
LKDTIDKENKEDKKDRAKQNFCNYTVAGRAIGFALEQPLHVVALACSLK